MIDYQREYSVLTAKQRLGSIIDAAVQGKVSKIRHGTRVAYVISMEMYDKLVALEVLQKSLESEPEIVKPPETKTVASKKEAPKKLVEEVDSKTEEPSED